MKKKTEEIKKCYENEEKKRKWGEDNRRKG